MVSAAACCFAEREGGRRTRFIMVLDKPEQLRQIRRIRTEMQTNLLCVPVLQTIVKLLVIAEIETQLLQLPLQIPVRLGDKEETGIIFS